MIAGFFFTQNYNLLNKSHIKLSDSVSKLIRLPFDLCQVHITVSSYSFLPVTILLHVETNTRHSPYIDG